MLNSKIMELKEDLVNEELSFSDLDSKMVESGFYSVFGDGIATDVKFSKSVVYTLEDDIDQSVLLQLEITANNEDGEIEESFYLKVLDVEEYL